MMDALHFGLALYGIVFGVPAVLWLIGKGLAAVVGEMDGKPVRYEK